MASMPKKHVFKMVYTPAASLGLRMWIAVRLIKLACWVGGGDLGRIELQ